jgi:hypothetical protein
MFFFEKKNQKTFAYLDPLPAPRAHPCRRRAK